VSSLRAQRRRGKIMAKSLITAALSALRVITPGN
jgi:hypothetical protein